MTNQNELILCSFLIDFNRFYRKDTKEFIKKFQSVFEKYCNTKTLLQYIESVANQQPICEEEKIILEAREISLTQTDKSGGINPNEKNLRNLTSVFFRVNISEKTTCKKRKYNFSKLTPKGCYPELFESNLPQHKHDRFQDDLIKEFEQEISQLNNNAPDSFDKFIILFEALLKKYLWCITASDYECEDISLYDHARITAAIANCLYQMRGESSDEKFKLVAGNFSGIQKYIFSLSSFNTENVAKKLRARSFFVDATVGAFAQYIIDQFHVPRFHILMLTGGKFYILLPNQADADNKINEIENAVETELFHRFKGQLSTNLAYVNITRQGLEKYDDTVTRLSERLNQKKTEPFHLVLADENGWEEEKFVLEKELRGRGICKSCRTVFSPENDETECDICKEQERLGSLLPNAKFYVYSKGKTSVNNNVFDIFLGYKLAVVDELKKEYEDAYYIEQIEDSDIKEEHFSYPINFEYRGNHIPTGNNKAISFDKIVKDADGKEYLAVLKADVDNLGYIFSAGLKKGDKHYGTISRVNTMSRLLTVFFSGRVQEILREEKDSDNGLEYDKVYSVFAGGDDLFLIGPWSKMPDLAERINSEFRKFVCDNPDITLSATIDLYHPKTHIATMAETSEENLGKVKNETNAVKGEGRNGVQFMGQIFEWEEFEKEEQQAKVLTHFVNNKNTGIDVTLMRRVSEYSEMYQDFLVNKDMNQWMFKSKLYYVLNRKEIKAIKSYFENLKNVSIDGEINKELYYASSTMKNVIMRTRE